MANLGLEGVPTGLNCERCGQPVTVSYIAHGQVKEALVSDAMQALVAAAARTVIERGDIPRLCTACTNQPRADDGVFV